MAIFFVISYFNISDCKSHPAYQQTGVKISTIRYIEKGLLWLVICIYVEISVLKKTNLFNDNSQHLLDQVCDIFRAKNVFHWVKLKHSELETEISVLR